MHVMNAKLSGFPDGGADVRVNDRTSRERKVTWVWFAELCTVMIITRLWAMLS